MLRGSPRSQTLLPQLLPRGIFDKETRRKALAVVGAAMELGSPIGPHGYGEEAVGAGLDKAARQIVLQGTSGLVNCMRAGVGHGPEVRTEGTRGPRRGVTSLRAVGWCSSHEVSGHRNASCCAVRLGPMFMLAPQRGQRHVASAEPGSGGGGVLQASCWRASAMSAARRALAR